MSDPILVVGEVGKTLNFYPNPLPPSPPAVNPVSFTGAVVTLKLVPPSGPIQTLSCVVSGDGTYATRTTLATDFAVPGIYEYQVIANYSSGVQILKSKPLGLVVSASI